MAILHIITAPDPILKKKSLPVDKIDKKIQNLIDDMVETMYADNGIGLAAVQIGIHKRILVVDLQDNDDEERPKGFYPLKIINPEVVYKSDAVCSATEGCLSVPGQYIEVIRSEEVTIKYLNENSEECILECKGWLARCMQHELDHLDGKILLDYVSLLKRDVMVRKLIRHKREKL